MDEYVANLTATSKEMIETERITRGQKKNPLWIEKRKSLLTASNFGKAAKTKVEPTKKLKAMLYSNFTTEAVQYGLESEAKAIALYVKEMEQEGITVKVDEVGLLQSKDKPFLAASLDGIVTNLTTQEKWGIEIKSPLSKLGMIWKMHAKVKPSFWKNLVMEQLDQKETMIIIFKFRANFMLPQTQILKVFMLLCTLVRKCLFSKGKFLWKAFTGIKNSYPDLNFFQKGSLS